MIRTFNELRADVQQAIRDLSSHLKECDEPEGCPEVELFSQALKDARTALRNYRDYRS